MSKCFSLIGFLFLSLYCLIANSNSFDKEQLIQRCQILSEELKELESDQNKAICRHKLSSAANKIKAAKIRIVYENYKDAKHALTLSINDLRFAEDISCVFKGDITKARMDAKAIKHELK